MSYQLLSFPNVVKRLADGAFVPVNADTADSLAYQEWLAAGNTPEPVASVTVYAPPTPREWLERLSPTTQAAVATAATSNASILLWLLKASGSLSIDVTAPETKDGVAALVAAGIITAADQTTLLAP